VGIVATGFCYLGGILQLFHRRYQQIFSTSTRSTNFAAADSSNSQIASTDPADRLHHQQAVNSHHVGESQFISMSSFTLTRQLIKTSGQQQQHLPD
jgi:hypothetical protein